MKIKLYLTGWRDRHGGSGVSVFYSERARIDSLAEWLLESEDEDDSNAVRALIEAGKFGEAEHEIGELAQIYGHEWAFETEVIDIEQAEQVTETDKEAVRP